MHHEKTSVYDAILVGNAPLLKTLLNLFEIKFKKIKFVDNSLEFRAKRVDCQHDQVYHLRDKNKILTFKNAIDVYINNNIKPRVNNRLVYCTRNMSTDVRHGRKMDASVEQTIIQKLTMFCDKHNMTFTLFSGQENGKTMKHVDQIQIFSEARIVVGPHGSAMANIIYLPRDSGCVVCEFTSGTEIQIQGGMFTQTYNALYGYVFELLNIKYNLIPFTSQSTKQVTCINTSHVDTFLSSFETEL